LFSNEKKFPDKRGSCGPLSPPLNPPLRTLNEGRGEEKPFCNIVGVSIQGN